MTPRQTVLRPFRHLSQGLHSGHFVTHHTTPLQLLPYTLHYYRYITQFQYLNCTTLAIHWPLTINCRASTFRAEPHNTYWQTGMLLKMSGNAQTFGTVLIVNVNVNVNVTGERLLNRKKNIFSNNQQTNSHITVQHNCIFYTAIGMLHVSAPAPHHQPSV